MTTIRCMIDLETLSTESNAAVVAIGAVIFTTTDMVATYEAYMNIQKVQGHQSQSTLEWWAKQDPAVRAKVMGGNRDPLGVLREFEVFYKLSGATEIWANAPAFDCTILRSTYKASGYKDAPWSFRDERCFRTLTSLAKERGIEYKGGYTGIVKHDPLSDAGAQARVTQIILKNL